MTLQRSAPIGEIYSAIGKLEAGNVNSFLIVEINTEKIDCVQTCKQHNGQYYVEILRKGGNLTEFGGIRIMSRNNVPLTTVFAIFKGIVEAGDTSTISKHYAAFKDNTARILGKREEARDITKGRA